MKWTSSHEVRYPGEMPQDTGDFFSCQHRWYSPRPFGPLDLLEIRKRLLEHVVVEEDQGVQRDVLRRRRYLVMQSKMSQERANFRRPHLLGMPLVIEQDKTSNPVHIRVLGANTHVLEA